MASCEYCGEWAGLFSTRHGLCYDAVRAGLPLPEDRRHGGLEAPVKPASVQSFSLRLTEPELKELAALVGAVAVIAEDHPTTVAESVEDWFVNHGWSKTQRSESASVLPKEPLRVASTAQASKKVSKVAIFWGVLFPSSGVLSFLAIYAVGGTPLQLLTLWAFLSLVGAVVLNVLNLTSEK
jgi:hypothetical protein